MSLRDRYAKIAHRPPAPVCRAVPDERRWALRKTGIIVASIMSDRLAGQVNCVVRDMSSTGARLVLNLNRNDIIVSAQDVPATFMLAMEREGMAVDCETVWCSTDQVGVRFLSHLRAVPKRQPIRIAGPRRR